MSSRSAVLGGVGAGSSHLLPHVDSKSVGKFVNPSKDRTRIEIETIPLRAPIIKPEGQ